MKIVQVINALLPVSLYGGTERVVWSLMKELDTMGHKVVLLCKKGSTCDFAEMIYIDETKSIIDQIPLDADVVHFHSNTEDAHNLSIPYVITMHGNIKNDSVLDKNTIFISQNHASRYGSDSYVHNGLDWSEYTPPNLSMERNNFHFLAKAAWRVKNVKGAINIAEKAKQKINILGGTRLNFKMGFRFTLSLNAKFYGIIGGERKEHLLMQSRGLIFPVLWHEPFGLAIIESLYYGCPVFGTPYGSLPELINKDVGFLSNSASELAKAIDRWDTYDRKVCHQYALEHFSSTKMAMNYLNKYQKVINGESLNISNPRLKNFNEPKFLEWKP